jgi:hypothetical protein
MSSRTAEPASLPLRICIPFNWSREGHTALTTDVLAEFMVQNSTPWSRGIRFVDVSEQMTRTIEASHWRTAESNAAGNDFRPLP